MTTVHPIGQIGVERVDRKQRPLLIESKEMERIPEVIESKEVVQLSKIVSTLIHGPADDPSLTDPLSRDNHVRSIPEAIDPADHQDLITDLAIEILPEATIDLIAAPEEVRVVLTDPAIDLQALLRSTDREAAVDRVER